MAVRPRSYGRTVPGPFFDQQVGVNPAEPEAVDRRAPRAVRLPWFGLSQDAERAVLEAELGRWSFEVRHRGQRPVSERQQHLGQGGGPRPGQQVAYRRFDAAENRTARLAF